jgi:hypothetical protein
MAADERLSREEPARFTGVLAARHAHQQVAPVGVGGIESQRNGGGARAEADAAV